MRSFLEDLRFAFRVLRKSPGFAVLAVATLALGLGATTAMYSVVSRVLLRPLPYAGAERIVRVWETSGAGWGSVSRPNFEDWRAQSRTLTQMSEFSWGNYNFVGASGAERLLGGRVSSEFFNLLGARFVLGRPFAAEQFASPAANEVILTHDLWQTRFGGERDVIGRAVDLNGRSYTIVGVLDRGFEMPMVATRVPIFVPHDRANLDQDERGNHYLQVIARLAPGATLEGARAELKTIAAGIAARFPDDQGRRSIRMISLDESLTGNLRGAAWMLFGAVLLVLVIACANVANMLLARAAARQGEISVRLALGARRGRLIRQLMTESLVLAVCGGALGMLIAIWGVDLCAAAMRLPPMLHPAIDVQAFAFAAAAVLGSVLVFGLAPALGAARLDLAGALREGARRTTGARHRLRSAFVIAQIGISFALIAGAGLLVRSFVNVATVEPGFDPRGVVTMQIALPPAVYADDARIAGFYDRLVDEIRALPGVATVGLVNFLPFSQNNLNGSFEIAGRPFPRDVEPVAEFMVTTPDYFKAMGAPMVAGRALAAGDAAGSAPVLVINQALAAKYFPGEDPVGKRIVFEWAGKEPREIVGVVGDMRRRGLEVAPVPEMYVPFAQRPNATMMVAARFAGRAGERAGDALRRAVARVDPQQAVYDVSTMDDIIDGSLARRRVDMTMLALFAGVALVLAALGIYGVVAVQVVQRTREIGIRMALGARAREVQGLVLRQGLKLVGAGLAAGVGASLALAKLITSLLFGTRAADPLTFAATALALAGAALLASWIPARRATKIDPMIALRAD